MIVAYLVAALAALVALIAAVRLATGPSRLDTMVALHSLTTALAVCVLGIAAARTDPTLGVAAVMIVVAGWAATWALTQHLRAETDSHD